MDRSSGKDAQADGLPQPRAANKRAPTVLQLVPALESGGVERGTIEIVSAIVAAGGRALVASEGGALEHRLSRAGGALIRLPMATKNPLKMRRNMLRLRDVIAREGVDLVHARSRAPAWSGYLAARASGTPFVTTYHGAYNEGPPLKRRYNAVMALGRPTIAVSQFIADLIRRRHGLGGSDVVVIPRGADLDVFSREAVAPERIAQRIAHWGMESESRPVFMLPGRMTRWKGQEVFIDACARLRRERGPEFVALMVGGAPEDSSYVDELEARAHKLGCEDCIRIGGHCDDMPAAYLIADAVVSASTDPEAFGRVAVEAQAMGKPVLASDHGGARETVEDGVTGVLLPPGDAHALAQAMAAFLDLDRETRAALGVRARARVEALYSIGRMQQATLDVYERATGLRFPGRGG